MNSETHPTDLIVDQPFRYEDFLYELADTQCFEELVEIILGIEGLLKSGNEGLLIAIKGNWGTGKTSILRGIQSYFVNCRNYPAVFFPAWKYQEDDHPLIPLLLRIRGLTSGNRKGRFTRLIKSIGTGAEVVSDLLLQIASTKFVGTPIGKGDLKELLKDAKSATFKLHSQYEENFEKLSGLIKELTNDYSGKIDSEKRELWNKIISIERGVNTYMVILVDDLDRLLPDRAIHILEMIRFYLQTHWLF